MVKKEDILWLHRENIRLMGGGEELDVEGAFDFPLSDNDGVNDKVEYDRGTNPVNGAKPDGTKVNADRDGNGYISMKEAYLYAFSHDSYNPDGDLYVQHDSNGDGRADDEMQEHPQICEFFNLAERCYL